MDSSEWLQRRVYDLSELEKKIPTAQYAA